MADEDTSSDNAIAESLGIPVGGQPPPPAAQAPVPAAPPEADPTPPATNTLDVLPEWAQKEIRDLRREDKPYRQKARQYDDLVRSQMTETQKAVEEAKSAGRSEALTEVGQRLAAAEIKAALAGIVDTPEDVIEDLNLARYIDQDGNVDTDAVTALQVKYTALTGGKRGPRPISHGRQSNGAVQPTPKDQFAAMVTDLLG